MTDLLLIGLLGGAASLDRTAFLQSMASRPLVVGSLAGAVLGAPQLGLLCGVLVELLWLMNLPVGASVPPDDSLAALLAVLFALVAPGEWSSDAKAALGVLTAAPFGFLGRALDVAVRRWNAGLVVRARKRIEAGEASGVGTLHMLGAARFFLSGSSAALLGGWVGTWVLGGVLPRLPFAVEQSMELVAVVVPLVGGAAVMAHLRSRREILFFSGGFLGSGFGTGGWPVSWQR